MQQLVSPRPAARRLLLVIMLLTAGAVFLALNLPAHAAALTESARQAKTSLYHGLRNRVLGPPLVGLQVGHLEAASHPQELAALRVSTGGFGGGRFEVEVNQAVAVSLAERLGSHGIAVDLLPATVPPRYRADLVVSIHADSSPDTHRRGYKSAVFRPRRNPNDARLKAELDRAYLAGSGLPDDDDNVTGNMLEYYAFNRHYRHSLARRTPAAIVELGYLTHPKDSQLLATPDRVAALLETGIVSYLESTGRLPSD
ncbi:MAG: N-acetylmuramoyl-L-alanine amidase [Trueperaceae bacterium]